MRKLDLSLAPDELDGYLRSQHTIRLATINGDGTPHVVPLWFVWLEEAIYLGDRVIGLLAHPGRVAVDVPVRLPRPRHQITTRESPEFLRLRRELHDFIESGHA